MTKYKIVGVFNLFFGGLQVIYSLLAIFFTFPRLTDLYSEFDAGLPAYNSTYIVLGLVILMGIFNLFLGLKLFSKLEAKKYLKFGIALIIISLLMSGVFSTFASLSVVLPIYNLTSQL